MVPDFLEKSFFPLGGYFHPEMALPPSLLQISVWSCNDFVKVFFSCCIHILDCSKKISERDLESRVVPRFALFPGGKSKGERRSQIEAVIIIKGTARPRPPARPRSPSPTSEEHCFEQLLACPAGEWSSRRHSGKIGTFLQPGTLVEHG